MLNDVTATRRRVVTDACHSLSVDAVLSAVGVVVRERYGASTFNSLTSSLPAAHPSLLHSPTRKYALETHC